jgi:putative membrane protein
MSQSEKAALITGVVIVAVLLFIVLGFSILWGLRGGSFGMMGPGMMGGYGSMFLVAIFFIVLIGLIIWVVVAALQKSNSSTESSAKASDEALDILKRRYAQGEIDKEEYEIKKKDLT